MFRFLSLLSYDRYHSKTIITVPRIMQLSGGLMATGKDAHLYGKSLKILLRKFTLFN